jgi:cobalamin biosynthesis protein CbiG
VNAIATIDIKSKEPGILGLCSRLNAALKIFSAEELMSVPGDFEKSQRVLKATGTDNVCQRAVACAGARLITEKISGEGVTIALGLIDWTARF